VLVEFALKEAQLLDVARAQRFRHLPKKEFTVNMLTSALAEDGWRCMFLFPSNAWLGIVCVLIRFDLFSFSSITDQAVFFPPDDRATMPLESGLRAFMLIRTFTWLNGC